MTTKTDSPTASGAAHGSVAVGDTLICMIDEWRVGDRQAVDGTVTYVNAKGAEVCYLSGYRSRNDFVEWPDVVAKLDLSQPRVSVADGAFEGHFLVFGSPNVESSPATVGGKEHDEH